MNHQYKHLASFLAGWFHQDFDLVGESIEEIVAAYKKSASLGSIMNVRSDIDRLLNRLGDSIEIEFDKLFVLEIEPTGFSPTVESFLRTIYQNLDTERQPFTPSNSPKPQG
jgi:hypothetical protein